MLPIEPPYPPMEARLVAEIPPGPGWQFEPKWDGFRCLVFRDGDRIELQSKAGQPIGRYFPDIVAAIRDLGASRFVLDGEIVIPVAAGLSFEDLLLRIHPAASRVRKLAVEHPARFVAFDLLVDARGQSVVDRPLGERRRLLEAFAAEQFDGSPRLSLSPATTREATARRWLDSSGARLDGIVAKRLDQPYLSGDRSAMQKIKLVRTADCVVGGFRYASSGGVVGSLLLGLYNREGLLDHVGFTSGIRAGERKSLTARLEALVEPPGFTGRAPGGPSRWSTERSAEWQPLRPELVVEVRYDHFSGGRFRHGTRLLRWRPDKPPGQCTLDQVAGARPASRIE